MNKYINIVLIIALVILGILYFKELNSGLTEKSKKMIEERELLNTINDSLKLSLIQAKKKHQLITDSLRKEESKIKHIPYEKIEYIDRTLDDAVIILNSAKYMDQRKR